MGQDTETVTLLNILHPSTVLHDQTAGAGAIQSSEFVVSQPAVVVMSRHDRRGRYLLETQATQVLHGLGTDVLDCGVESGCLVSLPDILPGSFDARRGTRDSPYQSGKNRKCGTPHESATCLYGWLVAKTVGIQCVVSPLLHQNCAKSSS